MSICLGFPPQLPNELWDLILKKLSNINVRSTVKYRLISNFLNLIINNNSKIKYKLFLSSHFLHYELEDPDKSDLFFQLKQLRWCCKQNDLSLVKWLVKYYNIPNIHGDIIWSYQLHWKILAKTFKNSNKAARQPPEPCSDGFAFYSVKHLDLKSVCKHGNLELLQWLCKKFDPSYIHIMGTPTELFSPFEKACKYGHFRMVRWIIERFNLSYRIIRNNNNFLMLCACSYGDFEMVKWIVEKFNLTFDDLLSSTAKDPASPDLHHSSNHNFFEVACIYGRLEIAKWLASKFGLTTEEGQFQAFNSHLELYKKLCSGNTSSSLKMNLIDVNRIVMEICRDRNKQQLETIKWLYKRFRFNYSNSGNSLSHPMLEACENGHLEIAKWFAKTFRMGPRDIRQWRHRVLVITCRRGYIKIVKWLVKRFEYTSEDLKGDCRCWFSEFRKETIKNIRDNKVQKGQRKVLVWLNRRFRLEEETAKIVPGYYSILLEDELISGKS